MILNARGMCFFKVHLVKSLNSIFYIQFFILSILNIFYMNLSLKLSKKKNTIKYNQIMCIICIICANPNFWKDASYWRYF